VLVHPHEEVHRITPQPAVARNGVRADLLQRVAEMGVAVGIVDRRREEKLCHQSSRAETSQKLAADERSTRVAGDAELTSICVGYPLAGAMRPLLWRV
jgi:hypothetical protein